MEELAMHKLNRKRESLSLGTWRRCAVHVDKMLDLNPTRAVREKNMSEQYNKKCDKRVLWNVEKKFQLLGFFGTSANQTSDFLLVRWKQSISGRGNKKTDAALTNEIRSHFLGCVDICRTIEIRLL